MVNLGGRRTPVNVTSVLPQRGLAVALVVQARAVRPRRAIQRVPLKDKNLDQQKKHAGPQVVVRVLEINVQTTGNQVVQPPTNRV